ncbi:MAG: 30S ribosomal protein S15 [bacterium]
MLTKTKKQKIIKEVQIHATDTGSAEAQIGILSKRIEELTKHLKIHAKDNHSRRGLLQMVADRQTLLKYLQKKNSARYDVVIKKLDLKKKSAN